MSATFSPVGTWTGERFAHEAFVFDADGRARSRVLPFVQEGLDVGDPVVVVAGDRVRGLLCDALGVRTEELAVLAPAETFWQGGHQTLATYRDSMDPLLATGRPWRLVGEPVWLAAPGGHVWSRFEAVANLAFADYPYYSLCLHDQRRLSPSLVDAQLRVHPRVWDGRAPVLSDTYEPTRDFLRRSEPALTAAPRDTRRLSLDDSASARRRLRAWIDTHEVRSRTDEVLLAVYELVTNAIRVAGECQVEEWVEGETMVWQVRDHGPGLRDVTAGYVPPSRDPSCGRGLWIARSIADDSAIRTRPGEGTTVRLLFRVDRAR
jgi:anti-sigma regulatory factor (Ser/Thr protein kinase)